MLIRHILIRGVGNEIADQLANKGAETYFIGLEPFFEPLFNVQSSLSRQFLDDSGKRAEMLLTLTKSELKTVTVD
jgi:hypothetical protein